MLRVFPSWHANSKVALLVRRIDREAVEEALKLDFVGSRRNLVLVAPQGLGKTMIAQNLANLRISK